MVGIHFGLSEARFITSLARISLRDSPGRSRQSHRPCLAWKETFLKYEAQPPTYSLSIYPTGRSLSFKVPRLHPEETFQWPSKSWKKLLIKRCLLWLFSEWRGGQSPTVHLQVVNRAESWVGERDWEVECGECEGSRLTRHTAEGWRWRVIKGCVTAS